MNILDMRTVILLNVIIYIICTLLIVQLWRQNRRRFAGMAFWVFNFALQTAALILIVLRGAIPDWISIVLANILMFAGALLIYMGLERFVKKISAQLHNYVLFALYAGAFVYSTFIHPDLPLRMLIASVGLLIISFQCLWLLWRRVELAMRPLTFGVGMVFGGYCAVSSVRIVEYFVGTHAWIDYFHSGAFQTLVLVSYLMLFILLTYSLVLMVNKRLLIEIGAQEEKFTKAFYSAPYAITLTRLSDGTIVDVNESFVAITGYDRAEVLGKKTMDLRIWEDVKDRTTVIEALSRNGKVHGLELRFRKKSGEAVTGLFSAEIITIYGEKNILSSISDITDRKRMEEALRESEERYRALVENASDIVFRTDENGYFTFVNPATLRITGYEEGEILGKHYKMFIRPDMFKEAITSFADQLIKKIPNTYSEYPVIVKDGREIWFGQNTQSIFQDGKVTAFQAVARDITDRKRMEEALRDSEERYRTILENIEDGYFEVDIAGDFTFFNDPVCRMVGYTRAELMGMNNRQYTDKENSQILYQTFNKVFRTGEPSKGVDYKIIGKDGTKLYVESSTSLIRNISGQPIGFRGIMRNITGRKRMEEALRDSEKRYRDLSIVDDLTQLYNSRHFYFQLKIELDRSNRYEQPLTLLLLDLDNFKAFNDAYGHVEGDQVLSRLGRVVKRCLRETDFAYRYGGEEFTIILPMTTSGDGAVTAERIRTEFKKETFSPAPGQDVHVTVSIGLAQYKPQEEMKAFVHRVDQLMYQGKTNGKDRVCSEL